MRLALLPAIFLAATGPALAGGSYRFDGGTVIDYGDPAALQVTGALTLCAWVKSDFTGVQQLIAGKSANPSHTDPFLEYGLNQGSASANSITFGLSTGGAGSLALSSTTAIADITAWNWVCGAWDRALDGGNLDIHTNGAEAASYVAHAAATATIQDGGQGLRVGRNAAGNESWNGQMAYLQVWDRKLDADEMREAMHHPGSRRRGLVLYAPMTADISFPHTPVLDDFNRADGLVGGFDPSATPWTHNFFLPARQVFISVDSNEARSPGSSDAGSETWNRFTSMNQEAYYTLTSLQVGDRCNNLVARLQTIDEAERSDQYLCEFCVHPGTDSVQLWKRVDNGQDFNDMTLTSAIPIPKFAPGDLLGIRAVNRSLECLVNGAVIASSIDDNPHGPGHISMFVTDSPAVRGDDFGGGPYNGIRDLSGGGQHTSASGLIFAADGPPVSGGAR